MRFSPSLTIEVSFYFYKPHFFHQKVCNDLLIFGLCLLSYVDHIHYQNVIKKLQQEAAARKAEEEAETASEGTAEAEAETNDIPDNVSSQYFTSFCDFVFGYSGFLVFVEETGKFEFYKIRFRQIQSENSVFCLCQLV